MTQEKPVKKTGLANMTEAQKYLRLSWNAVDKMVKDGVLPHERVGTHRRIPWVAIYKFAGEGEAN